VGGVGGGVGAPSALLAFTAFHSVPLALGAAGGVVVGAYLLARTIFVAVSRQRKLELDRLIPLLAAQVEDSVRDSHKR
jgi:hypothetical protein